MKKTSYLIQSIKNYNKDKSCPNCNKKTYNLIDRKYFFTRLYECQNCNLLYRHPKDTIASNLKFYQEEYQQNDAITTNLPSIQQIKNLKESNFSDTEKNAQVYIDLIKSLNSNKGIKIIDYGSSWGYISFQFQKVGMSVQAYEVSKSRASFGQENLNIPIQTSLDKIKKNNDIIFSSHVIEHIPSIPNFINFSKKALKKDGVFIAECPNGSIEYREQNPDAFHKIWGQVHPNVLSAKFYTKIFAKNPYFITSADKFYNLTSISEWDKKSQQKSNLGYGNLLVIVYPNIYV